MPDQAYTFLGITLPSATWAAWFSGTASTLAVIVALFGYWLATDHQRRQERANRLHLARQIGMKIWLFSNRHGNLRPIFVRLPPPVYADRPDVDELKVHWIKPPIMVPNKPEIALTAEEISFLIEIEDHHTLTELPFALERYGQIVEMNVWWRAELDKLYALLEIKHEQGTVEFEVDDFDEGRALIMRNTINQAINALQTIYQMNEISVVSLTNNYNAFMRKAIGERKLMSLEFVNQEARV